MYIQSGRCLVAEVSRSYISRHLYDLVTKRSSKFFVTNHQGMNNDLSWVSFEGEIGWHISYAQVSAR